MHFDELFIKSWNSHTQHECCTGDRRNLRARLYSQLSILWWTDELAHCNEACEFLRIITCLDIGNLAVHLRSNGWNITSNLLTETRPFHLKTTLHMRAHTHVGISFHLGNLYLQLDNFFLVKLSYICSLKVLLFEKYRKYHEEIWMNTFYLILTGRK